MSTRKQFGNSDSVQSWETALQSYNQKKPKTQARTNKSKDKKRNKNPNPGGGSNDFAHFDEGIEKSMEQTASDMSADLGNDVRTLPSLSRSGGKGDSAKSNQITPTASTTTETTESATDTEAPTKDYYDISGDDAEIMREIQALEAKGWNERDYSNNQRYQNLVNEMAKRHPEDDYWKTKANNTNTASQMHNKFNYNSNYQDIIDSDRKRGEAEDSLKDNEGKERRLRGYIPSFLMKDYGNPWWAISGKKEYYKVKDSTTGEDAEFWTDKAGIKKHNKRFADEQKKAGLSLSEPDENGKVNLINRNGNVIDTFSSKEAADKWLNNHFELGEIDPLRTKHFVKYNGESYGFDTEDQAKDFRKQLNKDTRKERAAAWGELLYRMANSIGTSALNYASDMAGEGRPYKSIQQQEQEDRAKANQAMYYKNEEAKNDNVRKLVQMADAGMINLNNLTNEQMAMLIGAVGREKASQLINKLGNTQIDKFLAMDFAKNWDDETKNAYRSWMAQQGAGPANDLMIALASGKTTFQDVANKWNTQTKYELAKNSVEYNALENALKEARLKTKMTEAQADVIRELVAEQLKAAKLSNKRQIQALATDSVNSVAKVLDAVMPG